MFKSFINPQKIIGNGTKATSPEAFSNFMSGGKAALGSSVSSAAANNISSFARSGVAPAGNANITPLITNISTSIVNNVDNSVSNVINSFKTQIQSVLGGVQSNLSATIQNFSKDYQQRIQNKEDNKPSNILKGFLGLYQNAINFVTFFGDSKNNKKIEFTLKSLRNMFSDSFNTAAIIRQTIVKIVKQLSNLPTASGASGGLNLDVKVPGGALKQSGRATLSKFAGSRGGKLFGAGVVGAGAVGLGMMGMQSAKASQEEKLAETAKKGVGGEDKPNDFMKGLNSIAERFSDAIDSLLGRSKKPPGGGGAASSSGTGAAGAGAGAAGAAGAGPDTGPAPAGGTKYPELASMVVKGEGGLNSVNRGIAGDTPGGAKSIFGKDLTEMTVGEIMQGQKEGKVRAVGKYQFIPDTLAGAVSYTKTPLDAKFNSETQNKLFDYLIDVKRPEIGAYVNNKSNNREIAVQQLAREFASVGLEYPEDGKRRGQSRYSGTGGNRASISPELAGSTLDKQRGIGPQKPAPAPKVKPAPASTVNAAPPTQKAQEVSQAVTAPPGQDSNNKVEVASLAPDITVIPGGGSQDGGAVASLPAPSYAGPNVSEYGDTRNNNHPNLYSSVILGIIA
jgi:hypothetical protein